MNYNLLLLFATIVAILPVFFIKSYIKTNNKIYLLFALIGYILLLNAYIALFTNYQVSSNYVILQVLQILLVIIGSVFLFAEKLTLQQSGGVVFGIASIYLLSA
jgi:multidrug transporter EmrE-like cation transporter